jgi:hypothetical protein
MPAGFRWSSPLKGVGIPCLAVGTGLKLIEFDCISHFF